MSEVSIIKSLKIRAGFNDISGVLVTTRSDRKSRNLGSLRLPERDILREGSPYKETKWEIAIKVADETVVLRMVMQQNVTGGKGLC